MKISIRSEQLILDVERALYFPERRVLVISDLHLGKAAHFRKAGIAIPDQVAQKDLQRLSHLLDHYQPHTLVINGDMFHSDWNEEIAEFGRWKESWREIRFILVKGNHDRQHETVYKDMRIEVFEPSFQMEPFCFVHDAKNSFSDLYPISGHLHPGVLISNKVKQRLRLPCFYFGEKYAILPAFSHFTGLKLIQPTASDRVFAITPQQIISI